MKPSHVSKTKPVLVLSFVLVLVVVGFLWHEKANTTGLKAEVPAAKVVLSDNPNASSDKQSRRLARDFEKRKRASQKHLDAFLADGWKEVPSSKHDPRVVSLSPSLLPGKEHELRRQLETTRVSEDLLENAMVIALEAEEHRTRAAAVNAIGHSSSPSRDAILIELFESLIDDRERGQALGFIQPAGLDTPESRWLIAQLAAEDVPPHLKMQIPAKLVFTGLHENQGNDDFVGELLEAVPEPWRDAVIASVRLHSGKKRDR